jgi:beta-glucanase (GH16 family)
VTVNGRRVPVTSRPATFSIRGLSGSAPGGWHRLVIRGRKVSASARFAIGVRKGGAAPTLVLARAPARQNARPRATFAYSASGGTVSCVLDGAPHPCSARTADVVASPGRHVFRVRARKRGGSSASLTWSWTVASAAASDVPALSRSASSTPASMPADWRLLLSDDFDGTSLDTSKWLAYGPNWPGHGGNGIRDGSAVSVGGGVLTITARMAGGSLVSGAIASYLNFTYGRVEFRVRTDSDPSEATSGAVLLWPENDADWPVANEYDIYETGTRAGRYPFDSFMHYGADNRQYQFGHPADGTQWQDMAMDWTPEGISVYRDGDLVGTVTDPRAISRTGHHVCIQLDAFRSLMGDPVTMQVDHVRVYGPGT